MDTPVLEQLLASLTNPALQTTTPLTAPRMMTAIAVSFVLSVGIAYVYRLCNRGVAVRSGPPLTLVLTCMVTTMIIMPISTSILLSMGMVGALSIVRFRTAMKDPADIAFLFWGIAVGVCNGAGFLLVSTVCSLLIGVLVVLLSRLPVGTREPLLLVVRYDPGREERVFDNLPKGRLLSKVVHPDAAELTMELKQGPDDAVTRVLMDVPGVDNVAVVSYDGSYLTP